MACVDLEGCFQGDPLEYTDTRPEEIQELQKSIANYMGAQLGQTATTLPSGFPVAAGTNQLQTNSAQLMNQLMGGGNFGMAPYRTMGGVGGYGAGSTTGAGGGGGTTGGGTGGGFGGAGGEGGGGSPNAPGPRTDFPPFHFTPRATGRSFPIRGDSANARANMENLLAQLLQTPQFLSGPDYGGTPRT